MVEMSFTSESSPDRLRALPLELRERVYLFCGFPFGREWYHACEGQIVYFEEFYHKVRPKAAKYKLVYQDADGDSAVCLDARKDMQFNLLATSKAYNAEVAELLWQKSYNRTEIHVGFEVKDWEGDYNSEDEFVGEPIFYDATTYLQKAWFEQTSNGRLPPSLLNLRGLSMTCISNLVLVVHWQEQTGAYKAKGLPPPEGWCGSDEKEAVRAFRFQDDHAQSHNHANNVSQTAHTVRMTCNTLPYLEHLKLSIKNDTHHIVPDELARRHDMLSTLITFSLCQRSSVKDFVLSIPIFPKQSKAGSNLGRQVTLHSTMDIGAMPVANKAEIVKRCLAFVLCLPARMLEEGDWTDTVEYAKDRMAFSHDEDARFALELLNLVPRPAASTPTTDMITLQSQDQQYIGLEQTAEASCDKYRVAWRGRSGRWLPGRWLSTYRAWASRSADGFDEDGRPLWDEIEDVTQWVGDCQYTDDTVAFESIDDPDADLPWDHIPLQVFSASQLLG